MGEIKGGDGVCAGALVGEVAGAKAGVWEGEEKVKKLKVKDKQVGGVGGGKGCDFIIIWWNILYLSLCLSERGTEEI